MIYKMNFKRLTKLINIEMLKKEGYLKLKADGFMDLNVDYVGEYKAGVHDIAIAHNYEQNGDLIPDPDMVVRLDEELGTVEALTYQDQFKYQNVYTYEDGKIKGVYPRLKKELNQFLGMWLMNLKNQGHELKVAA